MNVSIGIYLKQTDSHHVGYLASRTLANSSAARVGGKMNQIGSQSPGQEEDRNSKLETCLGNGMYSTKLSVLLQSGEHQH